MADHYCALVSLPPLAAIERGRSAAYSVSDYREDRIDQLRATRLDFASKIGMRFSLAR